MVLILAGLRDSCPSSSLNPFIVWLLPICCAPKYWIITVGVIDSATVEAPPHQYLVPESHLVFLTVRTENRAPPRLSGLFNGTSTRICRNQDWSKFIALQFTSTSSPILRPISLPTSPLIRSKDIPYWHSFLPPLKHQEVIVETPWPIVPYPHQLAFH